MESRLSRDFCFFATVKDYYQILGVRSGAGMPEIRRAYRMLVQRLHPDINPDPAAHELIKEVNEAYDVLSDPIKKQQYDYRFNNQYSNVVVEQQPEQPLHRDPYFRQRQRPKPQPRNEESAQRSLMGKSLTFFQLVYKIGAVFCFIILTDYVIPRSMTTEQIIRFEDMPVVTRRGNTVHRRVAVTNTGNTIIVDNESVKYLQEGDFIEFHKSRILGITTKIATLSGSYKSTNFATVLGNFLFLPILIGIGSAIGLLIKSGTLDFKFSLGVAVIVIFLITILLL